ncbi:transmembrane protein 180-like [Gigantopelta aegis]|uniref:transmembrane protein 180-like n=1 Tax=Gigantopelta aegis TaxID=1735272 RepID=UPI001B888224|nr:transmembrane protein 180-like [Gigantopelta aegis]
MAASRSSMFAYCATSLGFTLLSGTFSFYYVKVFLNEYHIDEKWFHFAQLLYLVWNAINDPLFAYCQDTQQSKFTRTRRHIILYTAPLFSLSYLLAWFPWQSQGIVTGLHLIVALCLYDTMFTFIGLAMCCLFTEIAISQRDRVLLTRYSHIVSLPGSFSVTICEFFSDSLKNFQGFQITTVIIAILACALMLWTGMYAHTHYDIQQMATKESCVQVKHQKAHSSILKLTWNILSNQNFLAFVITNFCQEFHRAFLSSFMAIICDQLVAESEVPLHIRSVFYGSLHVVSSLVVIFVSTTLVRKFGYFTVIRSNFIWKIVSSLSIYYIGRRHPWILMVYFLVESAYVNSTFSLFNMPLSDVADADMLKHNRQHPLTSMVYGTNALVVKPSQSLSPMLIVAIINRYGYESFRKKTISASELEVLKDGMFLIVWCLPLVVGTLQLISWSFYNLRNQFKSTDITVEIEPI